MVQQPDADIGGVVLAAARAAFTDGVHTAAFVGAALLLTMAIVTLLVSRKR